MKNSLFKNALLEIGTEEIPARFMRPALEQLSSTLTEKLTSAGLSFSRIEVLGTPRRLAALIFDIPVRSKDREEMVVGPPPKAAKNDQGDWTSAATGFAKAQNIGVEKLVLRETPKGERWVAMKLIKGQKTEQVLKEVFAETVLHLSFPKSMIWDSPTFRFARPLRWLVALYNSSVIRLKVGDVTADRKTYGMLSLGGQKIIVTKPEKYKSLLQGRCILVDPEQRKKNISSQLESVAKKNKASVISSDDHLEEVVFLTEYPSSIVGRFPEEYLALPREILVMVLKKHQKFFPMESLKGQLINSFVGVRNGPSESQEQVREGYERVVNARLSDAKFFVEKDSRVPLDDLVPRLSGVGFHEKLGNMFDKTERIKVLVQKIGNELSLTSDSIEAAARAAHLCKADLLTQIVGELPELQGIAGRFYTEKTEKKEVANAIEEHYWPLVSEGQLPRSSVSSLVAIADKMDTLAADFSIGLSPSGSADPYGLRRMSIGVIRILMDQKCDISLSRLVEISFENLGSLPLDRAARSKELLEFFVQRATNWFLNQGYRSDEIEAVLAVKDQGLLTVQKKLESLKEVRGKSEFGSLANAIKRARNILTQAKQKGFLPSEHNLRTEDLSDDSEKELMKSLDQTHAKFYPALEKKDFEQALLSLAPLKGPVDQFFEKVMIMVDDENTRSRRLKLLMRIREMFDSLIDFSKLQGNNTLPSSPAPVNG